MKSQTSLAARNCRLQEWSKMVHSWSIVEVVEKFVRNIQCLSPAKKYKLYKSSINKSLHTVQKSLHSSSRGHCEVIKALRSSPTYKEFEIDAISKKKPESSHMVAL